MIPPDARPDPAALLRLAESEERRARRGRLKVFLGASPGVGKTFAMLEYAHARRRDGADVVIGLVETHGRAETAALLRDLEQLPRRSLEHRGVRVEEFDLDAALARRPGLLVVDELAHTNVPGSRHAKRWQDVEELLDAGLDVCTALNIQHLESLNDVVAQITGVAVRETVPDVVLERADEVELVDVSAEVLEQRLREGKVYLGAQAGRALDGFFRRGNLVALRELALRRTAERVDADLEGYRTGHGITAPWPAAERILVCVAPTEDAASLVRHGARLARRLRARWTALYVETPERAQLPESARNLAFAALHLAEQLGADAVTQPGIREEDEVVSAAARRNATLLVVGTPSAAGWWELRRARRRLQALARAGRGFTLHVVPTDRETAARRLEARQRVRRADPWPYAEAAGWIAGATALGWLLDAWLSTTDVAMIYLLAVTVAAARVPAGPAVSAAIAAILAFDFLFVPPFFTLAVADASYLLTFACFLAVAVGTVRVVSRLRAQTLAARERETQTGTLYALSRRLAGARRREEIATILAEEMAESFAGDVVVLLGEPGGEPRVAGLGGASGTLASDEKELVVARWVLEHRQPAGLGTDTLGAASARYVPVVGASETSAVLGVRPRDAARLRDPAEQRLLDTAARLAGTALDRVGLAQERQRAQVEIEAERLRTSLLSSLSHDLRTPLGAIEGAASSLLDHSAPLAADARDELAETILEESRRMTRLVGNLLEMVKVESASLAVSRELQPIEEVVGSVLLRLDLQLEPFAVETSLPADLPLVPMDGLLIEQVFANLLENAAKYAPPGSRIRIAAQADASRLTVSVEDEGPGVPTDQLERIFDKFHRVPGAATAGVGLGLAICAGIVRAHGGTITAANVAPHGLRITFTLPLAPEPTAATAEPTTAGPAG